MEDILRQLGVAWRTFVSVGGHLVVTWGSLGSQLGVMWGHLGVTWESLVVTWDHLGVPFDVENDVDAS